MAFEKPFAMMNAILKLRERTRHVVPPNEDHSDEQCWCEPRNEWIKCADGETGLVVVHNQKQ